MYSLAQMKNLVTADRNWKLKIENNLIESRTAEVNLVLEADITKTRCISTSEFRTEQIVNSMLLEYYISSENVLRSSSLFT